MRSRKTVIRNILFLLALAVVGSAVCAAQESTQDGTGRKVTTRVAPACPELARRMHIHGAVKLEVVVKPNGTVKSIVVVGGNPVLVQAASDAVTKWKFEAGPSETTELVQLTFVAQ